MVRLWFGHDEAQSELTWISKFNQVFAGLLSVSGAQPVALGHRCRDPDRLVLAGDRGDRGDYAPAPLARVERPIRLPRERYRSPIRGDDQGSRTKGRVQLCPGCHLPVLVVRGRAIRHDPSFRAWSRVR
jgi:hypothetical protein